LRTLLAVAFGVSVTLLTFVLGNWQTRRGDAKEELQARWKAAEVAAPVAVNSRADVQVVARRLPSRVALRGKFLPAATVFVDNRALDGVAGFQIVTPLQLESGPIVLIIRGWHARDGRDPSKHPALVTPAGIVDIEGLAIERLPRLLELAPTPLPALPAIWPNLEFEPFERAAGMDVARFVVQQTSEADDGLRRVWVRSTAGAEKHRGYALQWYGLAALSAGLTLYFGGRALRRSGQ
jgi:cytochrome oxidase assembly protein ShyY1